MDLPETDSEDEMPPGWEERCTADGLVFYAHHASQTTQWHHPRTNKKKKVLGELPFGWEQKLTETGGIIFVNRISNKTTFTDPRLAFAVEETNGPSGTNGLRQRHDASTNGMQILHGRDLSGRVAVVTGGSGGVGLETVRSLAYHGCTVVIACRDMAKGSKAMDGILKQRPNVSVHLMSLDLADLGSVRRFVQEFCVKFRLCHMLILNAGVFGLPHTHTIDGFESTFQVNHLAHFYLCLLMEPILAKSAPARCVFVSCEAHRFAKVDVDSIKEDRLSPSIRSPYTSIIAYCNSKLFNVLCAMEMQRRFGPQRISCYAVHPGNALPSELSRNWWPYRLLFALVRPFTKTLQQASASTVFCAASNDLARYGGVYVNNCVPCAPSTSAMNRILAHRLWVTSLAMIESVLGKRAFRVQVAVAPSSVSEGEGREEKIVLE